MTTELSTILALIAVVAIVVAGIGVWWINRVPNIERDASETIPLFTGLGHSEAVMTAEPRTLPAPLTRTRSAAAPAPARSSNGALAEGTSSAPAVLTRPTVREFTTTFAPFAPPVRQAPSPLQGTLMPAASRGANAPVVSDAGIPGTMVEGHAVRFSVPCEGTLQFLPGRLEMSSGVDAGRDIRFVQVPGIDGTDITFGRNEGALYRHIQLHDKTVSRQHAVLQWREGRWSLRNLSQTNPVTHNGAILDTRDAPCLQDGDRIEMGEVVFTFRSR